MLRINVLGRYGLPRNDFRKMELFKKKYLDRYEDCIKQVL
jgi:hypothetical protein